MKWILVVLGLFFSTMFWAQNQLVITRPSLKNLRIEVPTATPVYTSISFQVVNNMIHIQAGIDGQSGVVILDTGSPETVVNRLEAYSTESVSGATLSSDLDIRETRIDYLRIGQLEKRQVKGLALPFNGFGSGGKAPVLGLVGYSIIKEYETLFDFENQLIHLFSAQNSALHRSSDPIKAVELFMEGHLPIVTIQVGERKLRFGLDTGAATNIMDISLIHELSSEIAQYLPMEKMRSLNSQYQDVEAAVVKRLSIDDYPLQPMKFLFMDLSKANCHTEEKLDGLLGYAFFSQLLCSINYQQSTLYIWERPSSGKDVF